MSKQAASSIVTCDLRRLFRSDSPSPFDFHLARLCVLYEDLKIELLARDEESIEALDVLDPKTDFTAPRHIGRYRKYYFLRRAVATLCEFAEALRLLRDCPDFRRVQSHFDNESKTDWDESIGFLDANELLIKNVRNDIGGHFGSKAADYAVRNLSPDATGKIEIERNLKDDRHWLQLHLAGEIASSALLKSFPSGQTPEDQIRSFFQSVLLRGWGHATRCMNILVVRYMWPGP